MALNALNQLTAKAAEGVENTFSYIDSGVRNVISDAGRTFTAIPSAYYGVQIANYLTPHTNISFCKNDSAKFVAIIGAVHSFVRGLGDVAAEGKDADAMKNRKLVEWTVTIAASLLVSKRVGITQDPLKNLAVAAVVYWFANKASEKLTDWLNREEKPKAPAVVK